MGAGKSSIGALLAQRLGWSLIDSDDAIQVRTGKTVRQLRDEVGVDAMHAYEAEHLLNALTRPEPTVIGASASVVEDPKCRAALADPTVFTIWLRATARTLATRFLSGDHRPAYGDDPETFLAEQSARRFPLFEAVSRYVIDVDNLTIEDATARAWSALGSAAVENPKDV